MSASLRVLLVEDSEDAPLVVAQELERHSFVPELVRVQTQAAYQHALATGVWDVIICDYFLPGFNALTALQLLKESKLDIPFIVISGSVTEETVVNAMKAGAHDYVMKYNLTRLGPAIERELREAQNRRARRQAEADLKENIRLSEAKFRGVVDSLAEGLLITDLDDTILYANARMTELTGYAPGELNGCRAYEKLCPPHRWESCQRHRERRKQGICDRYEMELIRKDGSITWAEISAAPLRDPQGAIVGTVGAITDISERRQAREALQKSQESLLRAQSVGRVGSWEVDLGQKTLTWSPETFRIFGRSPENHSPSIDGFYQAIPTADREMVRQAVAAAIEEKTPYSIDHRVLRPDGSERHVHEQAEIVCDGEGKPVRIIGTVQDVTERKQLEEQLRHSQKMEAVGQLAGGIAHDFNNILTVIRGYTDLVLLHSRLPLETRNQVEQIAHSAERASKLTRQLLAFSRRQFMQFTTLDLNELLRNLTSMLQRLLGEHIRLELNLESPLPAIRADAGMIEQVLVNLAVNSRDAMPRWGRLLIQTSVQDVTADYCRAHAEALPGRFLRLDVIDTGCGMDAETLQHLFEPFYTTKGVGKGTGLGLSTVYGIVKQHNGWIQVHSKLDAGTAFRIFFPLTAQSAPAAQPVLPNPGVKTGGETILLVEDEGPLREMARTILERYGYRVLPASSGPDALKMWKTHRDEIQLLLTDIVMPEGMTGRELALTLLKDRPDLKVLYTSGYSVDFVEGDLYLREGVNFLPKPYTGQALSQAVRSSLDAE
ncbi:MAG: PAS domain S-box protein [Verrucomicrobiota bacterium]